MYNFFLRSFYPYSIVANFLAVVSIPTFCRTKSNKKAQHRQNQSLSSLLRNFAKQNILRSAFVCRQLSLERHGSVKFGHTLCVRKFASLFRVFLQPLPVILTVLYFYEITFVQDFANKFVASLLRIKF